MSIKKYSLSSNYYVMDINDSNILKEKMLSEIESYDIDSTFQCDMEDNIQTINKTDWKMYLEEKPELPYIQIFIDHITDDLKKFKKFLHCKTINIQNVWFQQYIFGDKHDWHNHDGADLSFVYYAELPDQKYTTEFYDINKKEIYKPKGVTEGSMLVFPGSVIHRSPPIVSNQRKTIIAFNANIKGVNI